MAIELLPHQKEAVKFGLKNKYNILALEMGLGKSATALEIWKQSGGNLLIVCPSYLILNWVKEIRKFHGDGPSIEAIKSGSQIRNLKGTKTNIAIISYDLARKAETLFEWSDMVVADEAHSLKTMTAKRTEEFHKFIYENSIKRLSLLTGTPIKNRVSEYYSLLSLMHYMPGIKSDFLKRFPDQMTFSDYFSFRSSYQVPVWKNGFQVYVTVLKWTGHRNVGELKKYLKPFYIRFKSEDVLDLPDTTEKFFYTSDSKDEKLLEEFEEYFDEEDSDEVKVNASVKSEFKTKAALKKAPFTIQYVKSLLEEVDSVVVYTDQVESCEAIAAGLEVKPITGKVSPEARYAIARDFQNGKTKVLVATVRSFSTGIDLTSSCNLVFNDLPWVPGDISQAIFRIKRITQKRAPVVHYVLGSPQDKYIMETLQSKIKTISEVT